MQSWLETIRILAALGFTGLLVMLRLEADRFGAAEYAETDRYGGRAPLRRRLSWYIVGLGLVIVTWFTIPDPASQLYLNLGDRVTAVVGGLIYGGIGIAQAAVFAFLRYRHLRLPAVASYPVALLNSVGTAFIDEATFRGAVLGFLIFIGVGPGNAIILQALLYALCTRLGAPGRDRYMLVLSLVIGLASGYVTLRTGGIGAAFLGHAITRFATFVATGHAGQPAPVGTEVEEIEKKRRIPEGWATVGTSRESINNKR
jgi:membrane protease YdiL (CAAX protease family)